MLDPPPLLELDKLCKRFGALRVTEGLSLSIAEGEALGVLGPNGAGKSTLFNLISGDLRPDSGRVHFAAADITALPAHARCRGGIGRSYQIPHPFAKMTVFENLVVGAAFGAGERESESYERCAGILEDTGLIDKANRLAGSLPLLDRKRLELARALATKPRLLLLDEIAGGLTEAECHLLVETIRRLRSQGVSIIWIEHVVQALLSIVDRLIVIDFGSLIAEGQPERVMNDPKVREVYMGISGA
ncbi:MAG: ABC transporter ATP-binding protein [Ectothiorhodospiraceae bacterium AqS1]|nr:ABC transporter ATP-binding protein [Ectothiorhodospiraceae bacterium AqS1]